MQWRKHPDVIKVLPKFSRKIPDRFQIRCCKIDCSGADIVLRLLAVNRYDHLCVTPTGLCRIAKLTTMKFDPYKEKTV